MFQSLSSRRKTTMIIIISIALSFMSYFNAYICLNVIEKCPEYSIRRCRMSSYCKQPNMEYICVKDFNRESYIEMCRKDPVKFQKGYIAVFRRNFDSEECDKSRYQPITFNTRQGSNCILKKSRCNEEGQVLAINGSSVIDINCRCDHTKGYAFVTTPTNTNFCSPSEEDCVCYKKSCPTNFTLSEDYTCKAEGNGKSFNDVYSDSGKNSNKKVVHVNINERSYEDNREAIRDRRIIAIHIITFGIIALLLQVGAETTILYYTTQYGFGEKSDEHVKLENISVETSNKEINDLSEYHATDTEESDEGCSTAIKVHPTKADESSIAMKQLYSELHRSVCECKNRFSYSVKTLRVVILGKSRVGKTSIANMIFGDNLFNAGEDGTCSTTKYTTVRGKVNDNNLLVIETPAIAIQNDSKNRQIVEIKKYIFSDGYPADAVLIVIKYDDIKKGNADYLAKFVDYFGEDIKPSIILVITKLGNLNEKEFQHDVLQDIPKLKDFWNFCNGRYCLFSKNGSPLEKEHQRIHLVNMIESIRLRNKLARFVNEVMMLTHKASVVKQILRDQNGMKRKLCDQSREMFCDRLEQEAYKFSKDFVECEQYINEMEEI